MSALGIGATYALFTSDAKTDVTVQAGKVSYSQTAKDLATFSGVNVTGDPATDVLAPTAVNGVFTNGGTASINDGVVSLSKMVPGDKVTFKLDIANASNVTTKMRAYYDLVSDDGLAEGLIIKVDNVVWDKSSASFDAWASKDAVSQSEVIRTIDVSIELPTDAGNEYQEKACQIKFGLDAVQGNAKVVNPISLYSGSDFFSDYLNLKDAITTCRTYGYNLKLNEDINLHYWNPIDGWDGTFNAFDFDGQGHTISNAVIKGVDNGGLFGVIRGAMTVSNITFDNFSVTTKNAKQTYAGVFVGKTYSPLNFDNVKVKNSKIKNNWQCGGIVGFGELTDISYNKCVIEDCFFGGAEATAGTLFGLGKCDIDVTDSLAKNVVLYTDSLDFASTAKAKGNFAVGHLYDDGNELTTSNYTETNVSVYVRDGLLFDGADTYKIINPNGLVAVSSLVNTKENNFSGKTIILEDNLDMNGIDFAPIGIGYDASFAGIFDGNNKTISNLKAIATGASASAGLFGSMHTGECKDLTIKNAYIKSDHFAGGIIGWFEGGSTTGHIISNCHVEDSTIISAAALDGSKYDNGDKVGGIAGYVCIATVTGCSVKNTTIQGYRDIGGIAGYETNDLSVISNNTVTNVSLINDRSHNYKNYTTDAEYDVNDIIGERASGSESGNTATGVTKSYFDA